MARRWKRPIEWLAARSGLAAVAAHHRRPSAVILSYHNIVPRGERLVGDRSLHVDQEDFGAHLDALQATHDVVPLDALSGLFEGPSPPDDRSWAVITFDDAYGGTMTAGLEELRARGLPGTVFVPPGLLGAPGFWWDLLATEDGLDPAVRDHALKDLQGRADRILDWARADRLPIGELPDHARPVNEATLLSAAAAEGVSLGAHTWTHPNLSSISFDEARSECDRSRAWLQSHAPMYVDWLAYPYGLHTPEVADEATRLFEGALRVEGGLAYSRGTRVGTPGAVPRVNVPRGMTTEGLRLRTAGLLR